jgi:hypothetical protein
LAGTAALREQLNITHQGAQGTRDDAAATRDPSLKPEQYSIAGEGIFSNRWQGNIMASFAEIEDNKYINMDQVRTIVRDPEKVSVSITWSDGNEQQFTGVSCGHIMYWLLPKAA